MRHVPGLALAALAAIAFLACGETQEVTQSESPGATTPAASASATPTASAGVTAPASPTPSSAPTGPTGDTPTPSSSTGDLTYEDAEFGVSLTYPDHWTAVDRPVTSSEAALDRLKTTEFVDTKGHARASVVVYGNPQGLSLVDWVLDHNVAFFDSPPEESLADGNEALTQPLNFEGRPSPRTYVLANSVIVYFAGATNEEYQIIAQTLAFG